MSHFARVIDSVVVEVIVADQSFINAGHAGDPATWIQTCNRTRGGVHLDGGTPLRKNYAAVGDTYDAARDAYNEGYGAPVTRRQRQEQQDWADECRRNRY